MSTIHKAFYAGPYAEDFTWVRSCLSKACKRLGLQLWNVGKEVSPGSNAVAAVHYFVEKCTIGYAVITGLNANVLYELGLLHAMSKPTVILADTQTFEKLPFDLRPVNIVRYDSAPRNEKELVRIAIEATKRALRLSEDKHARRALIQGEFVDEVERHLPSTKLIPERMDWKSIAKEAAKAIDLRDANLEKLITYAKGPIRGWKMTISGSSGKRVRVIVDINGAIREISPLTTR